VAGAYRGWKIASPGPPAHSLFLNSNLFLIITFHQRSPPALGGLLGDPSHGMGLLPRV
jgi:hypothetical protein